MAISPFLSKRELARAWQIAMVAGRYGIVPLVEATRIGRFFGIRFLRRTSRRFETLSPPVRFRLALAELGTTFIKLGQVLSARSDLLPPEYLQELAKLQDAVPPLPFAVMEPVFREEFGCAPAAAFAEFTAAPLASASIGQVYRARLHDGSQMTVKIQRPGVEAQVHTDLALMRRVAELAHRDHRLTRFDLPSLVREFSAILQDELLYTLEAHNAETLAQEMADRSNVIFPRVYWPFTSRRVLTTYWIDGMKITDVRALDAACIDRPAIATTLANSLLEQILLHGMFHGDPHPGNLLVTPDGTLAFLDTGMVGRLDRRTRELLIELSVAIFDQDIDAVLNHLQQLGVVQEMPDLTALRRDLSRLIMKYYFLPRRELRLGALLQRVNALLFEHRIRMVYEFGLLAKALFLAEGIAQVLDPGFDYNISARPVIENVRRSYYSPRSILEDSIRRWRGMRLQMVDLPRRLNNVLTNLERGTLKVDVVDDDLDIKQAINQVLVNRISFAIVIVGLLIASVVLTAVGGGTWLHYVGLGGLALDALFMIILLISMLRTGRI